MVLWWFGGRSRFVPGSFQHLKEHKGGEPFFKALRGGGRPPFLKHNRPSVPGVTPPSVLLLRRGGSGYPSPIREGDIESF